MKYGNYRSFNFIVFTRINHSPVSEDVSFPYVPTVRILCGHLDVKICFGDTTAMYGHI